MVSGIGGVPVAHLSEEGDYYMFLIRSGQGLLAGPQSTWMSGVKAHRRTAGKAFLGVRNS